MHNPVRCVRKHFIVVKSFSRSNDIVTDTGTGLQWQDDSAAANTVRGWTEAIDYCEKDLSLGGYDDWRLPNINELQSIVDHSNRYRAIYSVFQNIGASWPKSRYWSSTTVPNDNDGRSAWRVTFDDYGSLNQEPKSWPSSVRCVRGGQTHILFNPSIIMYILD